MMQTETNEQKKKGAGDSFMGALAFYLVNFPNLRIEETIKRCNWIASIATTREGTQDSYPYLKELPNELFQF